MARQYMDRVFQQILDKNLSEKSLKVTKGKKIVKVCLHSNKAVQISLQFDEFFGKKNSEI